MTGFASGTVDAFGRGREECLESTSGRDHTNQGMRSALGSSKDGSKSRVPPELCRARGVPLQQVDHQVGFPLSAGEQRRAAALHKLAAVRNFAHQDCEPCCVMDGLFVGSLGAARNLEGLRKRSVTHIVNASPIVPCFFRGHFRYKALPVYDDAEEDIARFFADATRFIARGRRKGGVLVHCYAGQSRSVAFILAYLCACQGLSLPDAYRLVVAARPCARPNAGFMRQLAAYESDLRRRAVMANTVSPAAGEL